MTAGLQPRHTAVVTAGGTREPIDEVRYIANAGTGALPCALAERLLRLGWQVHYVHGPGALVPDNCERLVAHPIGSAAEAAQCLAMVCAAVQPRLTLCAMAVADFSPVPVVGKLLSRSASEAEPLTLQLRPTAKSIDVVKHAAPQTLLLGFKLLAGASEAEMLTAAEHLARRCGADLVFANDIRRYRQGVREGLLIAPDATVVARLGGEQGAAGLGLLADQLVSALLARLM